MRKFTKFKLLVTYEFEIEVEDQEPIVQEYKDASELISDVCGYRFSTVLPVIQSGGVKLLDSTVQEI